MKILYATNESLVLDAIIHSQVVTLITTISESYSDITRIDLLTFEPPDCLKCIPYFGTKKVTHIVKMRRYHLNNMLYTIAYILRHGQEYDIIHVRSYPPMLAALLAKFLFRVRIIFDPRGLFADELLYYGRKKIIAYTFKFFERIFFGLSDSVVTVSDKFGEYLQKKYHLSAEKIRMIPTFSMAPNAKNECSELPHVRSIRGWESNTILCYSGSFEGWQLIEQVTDFFSIAAQYSLEFRFVFISKQKKVFEDYLKGRLPDDRYGVWSATPVQLPLLLAQFDYGILFRHQHIINVVAAPIKVKDYLLAGLKVILSDNIGDSSEFVRENDCGYVISELTRATMRETTALLRKPSIEDKQRIISTAAQAFSVDVAAAAYHSLYLKLFGKIDKTVLVNDENSRISVCMATYNGAIFLAAQVQTILSQLGPNDELIVVDDASSDNSVAILNGFNDSRIIVFSNGKNLGHVRSFERALTLSRNTIIFMADQDDLWLNDRVEKMTSALATSGAAVVSGNSRFIDQQDEPIDFSAATLTAGNSRRHVSNILGIFQARRGYLDAQWVCAETFFE